MQDGNIHCHINNVSQKAERVRDRSAIAAASYNAGVELWSDREQRHLVVRDKDGVVFAEILARLGLPAWVGDRAHLWNRVEGSAKRADARLAKKIEVAFTRDIPAPLRLELLREFAASFVSMGCVVDMAIHADDADHNPHAHLLLTTRLIEDGVFGAKIKALDKRQFITATRARWAALSNIYLQKSGSPVRVDHRSYKARGMGLAPTPHRGPRQHGRAAPDRPATLREHAMDRATNTEEIAMQRPTPDEQRDYPQLAERDSWPPAREAAPDMTAQERDEHQRYWQDQDNMEIERLANDFDMEHDVGWPELPEPAPDKYAAAVIKAQAERSPVRDVSAVREVRTEEKLTRDFRAERAAYQNDIYTRALAMQRTPEENELLQMAQVASPDVKEFIRDQIIQKRMEKVQEADNMRRRAALEKAMSAAEKEHLARLLDAEQERDLPELGPERELLPAHELQAARDDMLREVEREERERER